jgi:16S rRNA (guanine527-N7)-methyltransferase
MVSRHEIEKQLRSAGIERLPPGSGIRLSDYLDLLLQWNARINLTSVRNPEEIIRRHFAECIFAARQLPPDLSSLLDFGSGAGFPGILIAVFRPEIRVTLAESQHKKAAFLAEAARRLDLNCEVYGHRVEAMPESRNFDAVTMRSVDKMAEAIPVARVRARQVLGLFTGTDGTKYQEIAPEFLWREPIPLPPANQAVLLLGQRR